MSIAEIIAQLPHLTAEERAKVQARLDELAADAWQDSGELSAADRQSLDAALTEYQRDPTAGRPWDEVKSRIQDKLGS